MLFKRTEYWLIFPAHWQTTPVSLSLSWHWSFRDPPYLRTSSPLVEKNRWVESKWFETRRGSRCWSHSSPIRPEKQLICIPMKAGAGVKLNYDFSDLKYKHRPVVLLFALKVVYTAGLIAGVTLMPQLLASPHQHFIMRQVKLSSSTHCGLKQK